MPVVRQQWALSPFFLISNTTPMTTLYFGETRYQVYNAIKWASENSTDEEVRQICSMALSDGYHSAFGYTIKVNEYWATHIIMAQAEYLKHLQNNN